MCDTNTALAVAQLAMQAGSTAYGMSQAGAGSSSAPKLPTPTPMDTSAAVKAQVPLTRANAAANTGGGFAPDFLASLAAQEAGFPGMGTDILEELRRAMPQGA